MVGDRGGRHPELGGLFHDVLDPASAVQQAVPRVEMEMDERFLFRHRENSRFELPHPTATWLGNHLYRTGPPVPR